MTYDQLNCALEQIREWKFELAEISCRNYDPHGYDSTRRREIESLMRQEIKDD